MIWWNSSSSSSLGYLSLNFPKRSHRADVNLSWWSDQGGCSTPYKQRWRRLQKIFVLLTSNRGNFLYCELTMSLSSLQLTVSFYLEKFKLRYPIELSIFFLLIEGSEMSCKENISSNLLHDTAAPKHMKGLGKNSIWHFLLQKSELSLYDPQFIGAIFQGQNPMSRGGLGNFMGPGPKTRGGRGPPGPPCCDPPV